MANLDGISIEKGKVGPSALPPLTSTSILVVAGYAGITAPTSGLNHVVTTMDEVIDLGISVAEDQSQKMYVHRHCSEFFRIAGEGTKLYLAVVDETTSFADLLNAGAGQNLLQQIIADTDGDARQMAIALNRAYDVSLDGLESDLVNNIAGFQGLADWAYDNHMPLNILLEGRNWSGSTAATLNLRAIANVNATHVSVVIGQDFNYSETMNVGVRKYADVGTALGTLSAADINQNIGDNEAFNLTDSTKNAWLIPALSNNVKNNLQLNSLQPLEDKGFIFGLTYVGLAGVRWNNDHTCVPVIVDAENNMNEHTIAYGRTMNEASRLLRSAFIPKVKTRQPVDPSTGKLPAGVVKNFDGIGDTVFAGMVNRSQISAGRTFTDPNSDLLVAKRLDIKWSLVPYGNVGEIKGKLNLKSKI
jgi:hypothetical protein